MRNEFWAPIVQGFIASESFSGPVIQTRLAKLEILPTEPAKQL